MSKSRELTDEEVTETLELLAGIEVLEYNLHFTSRGLGAVNAHSPQGYAGYLAIYRKGSKKPVLSLGVAAYGEVSWVAAKDGTILGQPSDFYVKVRRI